MRQTLRRQLAILIGAGLVLAALALGACGGTEEGATGNGGQTFQSEGTPATPAELTLGVAHSGEVDTGTSYYVVRDLGAGASYRTLLYALTADADLTLYDADAAFANAVCAPDYGRVTEEICADSSAGSDVYLTVDGQDTAGGAAYTVLVRQPLPALDVTCSNALANRGSAVAPIEVPDPIRDGFIYQGRVADGTSFYALHGIAGVPHVVSLSNLADDVYLYVYDDADFTNLLGNSESSGATEQAVTVTPSGAMLYAKAVSQNTGSCFRIAALRDEGSVPQPFPILPDKVYLGMVNGGSSYYAVPVTAGTTYDIGFLTGLAGGTTLEVHESADFTDSPPPCSGSSSRSTLCSVTPTGGALYLRVEDTTSAIGDFYAMCVGTCS